ncbi:araC-like ligand binding domain protein [Burkholderia pseudomallei MSHR1328]|nr:araC-like ligand binding domain protein [Burkholderia pseudomallei MSHR1357]KKC16154.1 araC-like ligand binding domain protein [Burkholderia pseudomallei MSHR1328]
MHRVTHYRRADDGIEAISRDTDRAFPRHAHDEFGVGVIVSGAHRSWSGCGTVDARAGDTIMVNPGEVHDGLPLGARAARNWRMLYLTPALVAGFAAEEGCGGVELAHPAVRDARLAAAVERLFARVVAGAQTPAASIACDEALALLVAALLARHASGRAPGARARSGSRASGSTRRRPMPCRSPSSRVWRASAVFNCCAVSRASSASRRTPI